MIHPYCSKYTKAGKQCIRRGKILIGHSYYCKYHARKAFGKELPFSAQIVATEQTTDSKEVV